MKRRTKRIVMIVCGLLFIPVLVTSLSRWRESAKLRSTLARLDTEEPGWRLDAVLERYRATLPPPDENVANFALRARLAQPKSFGQWVDASRKDSAADRGEPGVLASETYLASASEPIASFAPSMALVEQSRAFTRGGLTYDPHDPAEGNTTHFQMTGVLLLSDGFDPVAVVAANRKDGPSAVRAIRQRLQLRLAFGRTPVLAVQNYRGWNWFNVCPLTQSVVNLLPDGTDYAGLQADLTAALADNQFLIDGLEGERALLEWKSGLVAAGTMPLEKLTSSPAIYPGAGKVTRFDSWARSISHTAVRITALEFLTDARDRFREKNPNRYDLKPTWGTPPRQTYDYFADRLLRDAVQASESWGVRDAHFSATVVALACERYRLQTGHWPTRVDEIPKSILPAVPDDPYAPGPIRMARTPRGVVAYSIGPDRTDDGGMLAIEKAKNFDLGILLLDPEHRRRPAP